MVNIRRLKTIKDAPVGNILLTVYSTIGVQQILSIFSIHKTNKDK